MKSRDFNEIAKDTCIQYFGKSKIAIPIQLTEKDWIRFMLNPKRFCEMQIKYSGSADCPEAEDNYEQWTNGADWSLLEQFLYNWSDCHYASLLRVYIDALKVSDQISESEINKSASIPGFSGVCENPRKEFLQYVSNTFLIPGRAKYLLGIKGDNINKSFCAYFKKSLNTFVTDQAETYKKVNNSSFSYKAKPGDTITVISPMVSKNDIKDMKIIIEETINKHKTSVELAAKPGLQYTSIKDKCQNGNRMVTMIVKSFPKGTVPANFVAGCPNLTKIILSDSVINCIDDCFDRCDNLKKISFRYDCNIQWNNIDIHTMDVDIRMPYTKIGIDVCMASKNDDSEFESNQVGAPETIDNVDDNLNNNKKDSPCSEETFIQTSVKNEYGTIDRNRLSWSLQNHSYLDAFRIPEIKEQSDDNLYYLLLCFAIMPNYMQADLLYCSLFGWSGADCMKVDKNGCYKLDDVINHLREVHPSEIRRKPDSFNWSTEKRYAMNHLRKLAFILYKLHIILKVNKDERADTIRNKQQYKYLKALLTTDTYESLARQMDECHPETAEESLRETMNNWFFKELYPLLAK